MKTILSKLGLRSETPSTSVTFQSLGLEDALLRSLDEEGYKEPTPIQRQAIPEVLKGRDVLGAAQTGTGKTAAFSLPILQRLHQTARQHERHVIRALVLAPTRELAIQIDDSVKAYGRHMRLGHAVIFGGVGQNPQVEAIRRGPAIVTATPGRLLDLMQQRLIDLSHVEVFVLDEADRMLDMGFIHDVRKVIAALPPKRQNLLFSATMPRDIKELADRVLKDPAYVEVTPVSSTAETIDQCIYFVPRGSKAKLLVHLLQQDSSMKKVLAFTRTKHGANRLAEALTKSGFQAEAIHGNKSQTARQRALANFKSGATPVLVASDIASRGIDVEEISHVVNYDLPNVPETYVHRIGRTGRAMATGRAIAFCDAEERAFLRDIERVIRQKVPVVDDHPFAGMSETDAGAGIDEDRFPGGGQGRGGRGGGRGGRPQQGSRPQQPRPQQQRPQESRPQQPRPQQPQRPVHSTASSSEGTAPSAGKRRRRRGGRGGGAGGGGGSKG